MIIIKAQILSVLFFFAMRLKFVILFFPFIGYTQTVVNNDSLLFYFNNILNSYRISYRLKSIQIDTTLKVFTDSWSGQMAKSSVVGHGSGKNEFSKRVALFTNSFKNATFYGENCTSLITPDINTTDINILIRKEIDLYIKKSYAGEITQYELAYFAFLNFKNSPPHNQFLLSKDVKYFYISCARSKGMTYVCYVAKD